MSQTLTQTPQDVRKLLTHFEASFLRVRDCGIRRFAEVSKIRRTRLLRLFTGNYNPTEIELMSITAAMQVIEAHWQATKPQREMKLTKNSLLRQMQFDPEGVRAQFNQMFGNMNAVDAELAAFDAEMGTTNMTQVQIESELAAVVVSGELDTSPTPVTDQIRASLEVMKEQVAEHEATAGASWPRGQIPEIIYVDEPGFVFSKEHPGLVTVDIPMDDFPGRGQSTVQITTDLVGLLPQPNDLNTNSMIVIDDTIAGGTVILPNGPRGMTKAHIGIDVNAFVEHPGKLED